jgi:hypothetical protein
MYRMYHVENGQRSLTMNFRTYENALHLFYSRLMDTAIWLKERPTVKKSPDGSVVAFFTKEGIFHYLEPIRFED